MHDGPTNMDRNKFVSDILKSTVDQLYYKALDIYKTGQSSSQRLEVRHNLQIINDSTKVDGNQEQVSDKIRTKDKHSDKGTGNGFCRNISRSLSDLNVHEKCKKFNSNRSSVTGVEFKKNPDEFKRDENIVLDPTKGSFINLPFVNIINNKIVNSTARKEPKGKLLHGEYQNGLNVKTLSNERIKWDGVHSLTSFPARDNGKLLVTRSSSVNDLSNDRTVLCVDLNIDPQVEPCNNGNESDSGISSFSNKIIDFTTDENKCTGTHKFRGKVRDGSLSSDSLSDKSGCSSHNDSKVLAFDRNSMCLEIAEFDDKGHQPSCNISRKGICLQEHLNGSSNSEKHGYDSLELQTSKPKNHQQVSNGHYFRKHFLKSVVTYNEQTNDCVQKEQTVSESINCDETPDRSSMHGTQNASNMGKCINTKDLSLNPSSETVLPLTIENVSNLDNGGHFDHRNEDQLSKDGSDTSGIVKKTERKRIREFKDLTTEPERQGKRKSPEIEDLQRLTRNHTKKLKKQKLEMTQTTAGLGSGKASGQRRRNMKETMRVKQKPVNPLKSGDGKYCAMCKVVITQSSTVQQKTKRKSVLPLISLCKKCKVSNQRNCRKLLKQSLGKNSRDKDVSLSCTYKKNSAKSYTTKSKQSMSAKSNSFIPVKSNNHNRNNCTRNSENVKKILCRKKTRSAEMEYRKNKQESVKNLLKRQSVQDRVLHNHRQSSRDVSASIEGLNSLELEKMRGVVRDVNHVMPFVDVTQWSNGIKMYKMSSVVSSSSESESHPGGVWRNICQEN